MSGHKASGEPPKPADNALAWLAKADSDLLNISNNMASERVPWDTVCYHAQQAAEKALKALLVHHGRLPAKTHDLVALLQPCSEAEATLLVFEEKCRRLTGYGVAARYPGDIYDVDAATARGLVEAAREIVRAIRLLIPRQS